MVVTRQQSRSSSSPCSAKEKTPEKRTKNARAKTGQVSINETRKMAEELKKTFAQQRQDIVNDHSKRMASLRARLENATQKLVETKAEYHQNKISEYVELAMKRKAIEKEIMHKVNELQHRTRDLMLRMEVALAARIARVSESKV